MFTYHYHRVCLSWFVRITAVIALALALALCWQYRAVADTGVITGSVVNVRSGPAVNYAVEGNLLEGTQVAVLEAQKDWFRISYNGLGGWVSGQYITVQKDAAVKVSGQTVNLRSGPGLEHKVVGQARKGDILTLLNRDREWSQVKTSSGLTCYIATDLIQAETVSAPVPAESAAPSPAAALDPPVMSENSGIRVFLDGFLLNFDVPPQIDNGRTMVPLRQIFESMGAAVEWNQATQTVTAAREGVVIVLPIGSLNPTVDGSPWKLDVPARIVEGRTLAPLRFVGEAYGGQVTWDEATRTVQMFSPEPPAVPAVAQPAGLQIMVREALVNLRSGPGTGFDKISAANAGEILAVVGEKDGWFQISRGGSLGWIAGWLVEMPGLSDDDDVRPSPAVGDDKLVWYYTSKDQDGLRINIESGNRLGCHIVEDDNRLVYTVMGRSLKGDDPLTVYLGGQNLVVSGENRDGDAIITVTLPPDVKYRKLLSSDGKCESVLIENRIVEVSRKVFGNIGDNIIIYTLTPCEYTYSLKDDTLEIILESTYQGVERSAYDYQISPILEKMTIKETSGSPPDTILSIETKNLGDYRIFQTSDDNALNIVLTTAKLSQDKDNRLVILDPGHGGRDPGASGAALQEKTVNLDIALKVGDILSARKFNVAYTRDNDRYLTQTERAEIANQLNAAVFVSIHNNANESRDKEGTETHYYASLDDPALFMQKDQRSKLATFLQQRMMQNLQRVNRGVKQSAFTVLTKTTMPSALVEIVFISNPNEEALLMNEDFKRRAAAAIADGITDYMNSR